MNRPSHCNCLNPWGPASIPPFLTRKKWLEREPHRTLQSAFLTRKKSSRVHCGFAFKY
jgi:hypothetical protein